MKHSLTPIESPYPEEVAAILDRYPKQDGYLLKLFRVFGQSMRFLQKGMPNLLDRDSPLSMREREIVILRVCANNQCEYEWGVHVAIFADHVGFTNDHIASSCAQRVNPNLWTEKEVVLFNVIDQLCGSSRIDEHTLEQLRLNWTQEQQLEIFALSGAYHTVSFVANNADLPLEEFGAQFSQYSVS